MRATSTIVLVIFSKVPFQRFPDHNYVKGSTQQLQSTLVATSWKTPYSWTFYGHGSRYANSFIKTLVNIMRQESMKVPWKLSLAKTHDPTLQITLH